MFDADAVLTDDFGGGARAAEHLVAVGHRRIGVLGEELYAGRERLRGFASGLACHGVAASGALVRLIGARAGGAYEAVLELLRGDEPPTALFTSSSAITMGAVRALHDLGLQRRVALAGFGSVALGDVVEPGLTLLEQDPAELGRVAAELLFARLDGFDGPPQQIVLAPRLVARGSGELPALVAAS